MEAAEHVLNNKLSLVLLSPSTSSSAGLWKGDPSALGKQESGTSVYGSSSTTSSSWERERFHSVKCEPPNSFTCFNGGECVHRELCDCSRFNATGSRCQAVYNTGAERDHICRTWGQYHFETFDGLYYYFSGKSTYVLVRQNELDEQSFSIQVHNDPECQSSPYSCKRSVSLFFSGDEEIKLSSEVTSRGLGVQLPQVIGNVHIQKLAGYILVRHQYAFTLAWDGISAVYIKMTPDYLGKTHGLCGNNNAVLQDDLVTSYGKLTEDIVEFVESWRENPPQGAPKEEDSFNYEPPCLMQSQVSLQKVYALCNTLLWPPFEQCHDYVSPLPFMASCTNDLCMSASDNGTWCRALTEYARACAHAGKPLHRWRTHFQQCVITCDEQFTYNECINCCPVSCQQKTQCIDSELPCVDGCYCPDGLIYENGLCVNPTECPCDYHGSLYKMGSVVHEECNNCTCIGGKWSCTNLTCPAECSVSGDIHFMTFDGRKYTFQASCQYILAKSLTSGKFTVSLQNAPCGQNQDGSCIQTINLIINQDPKRQVTLTNSGDVLVYDQYKISLPYTDDSFEIRKLSSVFLQIKTHIGLQILYDREGLRLYLQADVQWKDDTVGLCGTFNGNMQDDFLSPAGVPESTPQLFGNSWKTSSACALEHDNSQMDPCDIHLQAASYAAEACSILTKELFAPCHSYLSPVSYFEQCRKDTCKCGQICLCSALAHYTHQCRRYGVIIDFRAHVPECALSCEDTKEYSTCMSTCGQTCQALSMPETCSGDCVESCACPPGMYLNAKTEKCIQRNECPCYFQGIDYPPGENIITSLGKCHCQDGIMSCEDNNIVHNCPAGQIYVNCSDPQVNIELSRERTCENQLLNLTISAYLPCVSGCACPPGLVKHGDACFEPDECPCSWKGKEYFPGDKVISSCHTCVCQHGSFQCTFHPCPSMCTAYGDRHYKTFDGLTFDFVGACKVHLVKSTSETSFSVIIENINCFNTGIICRKYIFINVGKSFIIFEDETGNPSPSSYIEKLHTIHVWKAGFFTVVHFPVEHVTILWDQRTTIHIQTGPQWQGELTGLCGNFDLKTVNEMRTPENFDLTNAQEFGSSWAAVECVDSSDIRNPCSLNPLREPFAKKECGILLSETFEACHPVVDVTWFYSNCLTDTCGCNQGGDCECFCTSVSAYAHQCCQHGVTVDWRSPRVCPYDCEYFNKALGKGPYKLVSYLDEEITMAAKLIGGYVFPMRAEDFVPGDAMSFMLTSGLYKPKAHDPNLVSFETADRPNYFLHLAPNDTLILSKWEQSEEFHNRSTFAIHKDTWLPGYSAFESFAKPGFFIHISASAVELLKYHHSEEFRLSTLFKLVDVKFQLLSHSTCEWRYDACTSPCFKTCRDPLGENCQVVPKVEGCVPTCPLHMLLDEVTQRCVYFEDCIEPAVDIQPSPSLLPHITSSAFNISGAAGTSKEVISTLVSELKETNTTRASKWQLSATVEKATFPTVSASKITVLTTSVTSNVSAPHSTGTTSGKTTSMAISVPQKANISFPSAADVFPWTTTATTGISSGIQVTSSISEKVLDATAPLTASTTHAVTRSKPMPTFILAETPSIRTVSETPVKTITVAETSGIGTRILPVGETKLKPEKTSEITATPFVSATKKTTYLTQYSLLPSYSPIENQTRTSEAEKLSIEQHIPTVANISETSFSPLITTLKLSMKPVSLETTKATSISTKEEIKATFFPSLTQLVTVADTEHPPYMVQSLTDIAGTDLATTQSAKTTAVQTKELPSAVTSLPFTTGKKEVPQTTSSVKHPSSSYFSPYSFYSRSTAVTEIPSAERPSPSVSTAASPGLTESKETLQTVSTTEYPASIGLNLTTTEYISPVFISTTKTSIFPSSVSLTTSEIKTSALAQESLGLDTTVPLVTIKMDSTQTMPLTRSPHIIISEALTKRVTTSPEIPQTEEVTSIYTRKPSTFASSPSSPTSLTMILLPLSTRQTEASTRATSPTRTSSETIFTLYPRSSTIKSTFSTEKETPSLLTASTLSITAEQLSSQTTASPKEMLANTTLNITYVTLPPYSEFSSRTVTPPKVTAVKEGPSLSTSVTYPSLKLFHTFSSTQYLEEKSVSPYELTQTPTAQTSLIKDYSSFTTASVGSSFAQTSPVKTVSEQTRKESAIPHFTSKISIEHVLAASRSPLTSKSSTTVYQPPTETLMTTSTQPAGVLSSLSPTTIIPAKVLLRTEKVSYLTDAVTLTYIPSTSLVLQTTLPASARKTTDLIFSTGPLSSSPKPTSTLPPLTTVEKEVFHSSSTEKTGTVLDSIKQAITEALDSRQTSRTSVALFPESESTSPSVFPSATLRTSFTIQRESLTDTFLTPRVSPSAPTATSKSATEKIAVLSKQVPLSTTTYSSTFPASKVLPATALSLTTTAASARSVISNMTTQNITIVSAASEKTAGTREPIATSLEPTYLFVSETKKGIFSETPESLGPELVTKPHSLQTPGISGFVTPTSKTVQTYYSPLSTNVTAVPFKIGVSILSTTYSSSEQKTISSIAELSGNTTVAPRLGTPSITEGHTRSESSLLMTSVHPNVTVVASVPPFSYLSTKPLYESSTEYSHGLTRGEAISDITASVFMPAGETSTLQTCVPITENECIKHICLDGQLIQVNKSLNCPYNATQPSCGVLGFAIQINGDKCCPKWECACRCTYFSDLSFVTFDGNHLALFKEASYIISQTEDETIGIHVLDCRNNTNKGHLNSTSLCLAKLNLMYMSNLIIVDRLNRKITVNSRYAWPTIRKYGFKIEDTGFMYVIETPTKIRIQWFHSTGVMIIEKNTTSDPKTMGLCGFCDGNSENDLMLPNKAVLNKTDAPSIFMDSWQVPGTLMYIGEDRHQDSNCSVMDCSECLSLVLNQTFSRCHPYVPPELFCDLWVQDVEYIQNPCVAQAAYVAMCNKFNICIEWRSSDYCPFSCSENFSYQACIPACDVPSTCQNSEPVPWDSESCLVLTEGCVCAEGNILHRAHSALCIPEEKCACTDSSGAPRAMGEIWKTSLSGCCMHKCVDNETIIPVEHNCSHVHDLECQRFGELALIVPNDDTCCPEKICICNMSLCEPLIPECKVLEKLVTYYQEDSCCPNYTCECDPAKCASMEQTPNCREDQTLIAARVESTCCLSYICACGACSDQIPKCQEGEMLVVDGNTTDRCCPAYQCVCEIYHCPDFKCVLGMSLVEVWSPEKCCPYRTCECACDTIPKPECKLGEKMQIDEQFQNSTKNVCNCVTYKCVRDKVCLSNERGVLRPGQTIVEYTSDGICHTFHCTDLIDPSTSYYLINTSLIDCAVNCEANQVYVPPKDLTTCCGSCKNVSCLHTFSNGTVSSFKPGTIWISNCVRYECTNTAVGPVLVASLVSCPPFNETECVKVGGYVVPFLEGCCKTCKEDGKFCKKVTVRMTIRKNDCRSNTPVNIVSCDGKCPSASIYNYNINTYARFCKCCRELGLQRRTVQLYCSGNSTWVSYGIQEPTDCSCQWS
ncbi:PREDICTED: otogelin [Gavialis gangeticus]|uniref:otogelin n=1 Tax=Gavialis gangeticus TaxID=94835 RepID=UPI00092EBBFA|nr:PREDICTED: otogelin [Gavialis gangeticus]